jgi:hypothetical protein
LDGFVIALAAGVLVYLGVMVANKALENTLSVNGAFQGVGLVAVGFAVTFMLLIALARMQPRAGEREPAARLAQSWSMAVWIGLLIF